MTETATLLVNIDVDDLDRAIAFYTQAFALKIGRRFSTAGVELVGANANLYLLVKAAGTRAASTTQAQRRYVRHWTPVHLDFVVADVDGAAKRAQDAGATLEDAIETHSWGRIAHLADPFGHGFCLIQFSDQGYDAVADRG